MSVVIKVENLSKQYRLGKINTGTIAHDIRRWWHVTRGKEDPYLKIGEVNDRTTTGTSEYVWALKDINFEVRQGEVLGIIGRNGAGKSTLLKILSRTTGPTTGSVKAKGRIASLLEVGTGFHPELTGRENVFLNGAVLGMTKREIKSKFDEIVDFSGVEKYIDTPVKRYSSGMYVRLAFAVAAHLEPEILIVDEVLAVGDAEFQKKCLGKMQDVSGHGRTVLFVSHNMGVIQKLCRRSILLNNGGISINGNTNDVIQSYLINSALADLAKVELGAVERKNKTLGSRCKFQSLEIMDGGKRTNQFLFGSNFTFQFVVKAFETVRNVQLVLGIDSEFEERISTFIMEQPIALMKGEFKTVSLTINDFLLYPRNYKVTIGIRVDGRAEDHLENIAAFKVNEVKSEEMINAEAVNFGILNHKNCKWLLE